MMIFSQVLFIIYAMFLPISFILSMIPTYEGMAKKALTKLFNTIMMRAGITLIITTAFSYLDYVFIPFPPAIRFHGGISTDSHLCRNLF